MAKNTSLQAKTKIIAACEDIRASTRAAKHRAKKADLSVTVTEKLEPEAQESFGQTAEPSVTVTEKSKAATEAQDKEDADVEGHTTPAPAKSRGAEVQKMPTRRLSSLEKKVIELLQRLDLRRERLFARDDALKNRLQAYCYWAGDKCPIDIHQASENFGTGLLQSYIAKGAIPRKRLLSIRKDILAWEEQSLRAEKRLRSVESLFDQKEKWAAGRGYRPPVRKVLH